jgi:hypothetical protein
MQDCTSEFVHAIKTWYTWNVVQPATDCYSIKLPLLQRVLAVSNCDTVTTVSVSLDALNFGAKLYATQQIKLLRVLYREGSQDQAVKVSEFSAHILCSSRCFSVTAYLASRRNNLVEIGVRSTQHPTLDR